MSRIALLQPFQREITDQVCAVALVLFPFSILDEYRIVVESLAWEDIPVIEAAGIGLQMPFPDNRSLIALLPQALGDVVALRVDLVVEGVNAVLMAVLPGQDCRTARGADGVRAEAIRESHSLFREPVDIRCLVDAAAVRRNCVGGMIVGHDEDDIGRCGALLRAGRSGCRSRTVRNLFSSFRLLSHFNAFGRDEILRQHVGPFPGQASSSAKPYTQRTCSRPERNALHARPGILPE